MDGHDETMVHDFRVEHPTAEEVFLTGEFMNWRIPGVQMRRVAQRVWELRLQVPRGKDVLGAAALIAGRVVELVPIKPNPVGGPRVRDAKVVTPATSSDTNEPGRLALGGVS